MDTRAMYSFLLLHVVLCGVVFGTNCTFKGKTYESRKTYIHPGVHQKCNMCTCSPTLSSHFSCTDFNCQRRQNNKCNFIQEMDNGEQKSFFSGCLDCTCTESGVVCTTNSMMCDKRLNLECEYEDGEHKYSAWMTWPMNDNCNEYCTCLGAGIPACSIQATCSSQTACGRGHVAKDAWNKTECGYCYCPQGGKAACGRRACETIQFAASTDGAASSWKSSPLLPIFVISVIFHLIGI